MTSSCHWSVKNVYFLSHVISFYTWSAEIKHEKGYFLFIKLKTILKTGLENMLYLAEKFQTFMHAPRLEKLYLWPDGAPHFKNCSATYASGIICVVLVHYTLARDWYNFSMITIPAVFGSGLFILRLALWLLPAGKHGGLVRTICKRKFSLDWTTTELKRIHWLLTMSRNCTQSFTRMVEFKILH